MEEKFLEFGIKRDNEERRDGGCSVVFDPETQKYAVYRNLKNNRLGLFGGGFDKGESEKVGSLRELAEESGLTDYAYIERIGKVLVHYHNSNKNVNRIAFATCFLIVLKSRDLVPTKREEHENFELIWVTKDEILSSWESGNQEKDYDHWIYFLNKAVLRVDELGYSK